ncbi:MAG: Ca2+-binding RTX toxin-like protein, partial [Psychromonas sp.]|uniref:tandem-95 repeat protein n=1 Tax=Psychromonas sp. TaxID=1884585 RepID=UPI0039E5F8A1
TADIVFDGINDAPTVDSATGSTQVENVALAGDTVATFTASDLDGDDVTFSISSGNDNNYFEITDNSSGVVTLTALGEAALANDALLDVTYTLGVIANDGTVNSAEMTADIVFDGINDAPTVDSATGSTQVENVALAGDTVATFTASDLDGDDVTFSISSGNDNNYFEITDNSSGVVTLTALGEAALGNDALLDVTYTLGVIANDGTVNSAEMTADIVFDGINDAPVAHDDLATVVGDGIMIDVVANDTDLDGSIDPTTVVITRQPSNGNVWVNAITGQVTYIPTGDNNGSDSFEYTVEDNEGLVSNPATVNLTVKSVNEISVLQEDKHNTVEDKILIVTKANGVLSNDSDVDDLLEVTTFTVAGNVDTGSGVDIVYSAGKSVIIAEKGTLLLNTDGSYEFDPADNYSGELPVVTYTTNTGSSDTLTITVTPVADYIDASDFIAEVGAENIVYVELGDTSNAIITTENGHSSGEVTKIEYPDGTVITSASNNYLYTSTGQGLGVGTKGDFRIDTGDALTVGLPTYVADLGLVFKNASGQSITFTMQNIDGTTTVQSYTFDNKANALSTMTLSSDKPFNMFTFVVDGDSNGGNGSTLVSLTTVDIIHTTYSYPLELAYGFSDTDGSESISSITLSGFPTGTDVSIYEGDYDGLVELVDNDNGTWSIDVGAFTQNGSTFSLTDLVVQTDKPLPEGFDPSLELTVVDGADSSVSILGGTESELLLGSNGNDLIIGESGNESISGKAGDDMLIGDSGNDSLIGGGGDDFLIGGEGSDTFIWLDGDSGIDHIADFSLAEGDKLDLSDLLHLEKGDNLDEFLDFDFDDTGTTISVHADGTDSVTQFIVLDGVNADDLGVAANADDITIINTLFNADHTGPLLISDISAIDEHAVVIEIPDDL